MKFTCTVVINQPIEKVIGLFENPENLKEWQDGFISKELLSGSLGNPGAKSRILFMNRNKEMELIETVQVNNLPEEFTGLYEHIHMVNTMTSRFIPLSENVTRYETDVHYTQFNGMMIKAIAFLMPGMFKKQVQKWLDQFKVFAEKS